MKRCAGRNWNWIEWNWTEGIEENKRVNNIEFNQWNEQMLDWLDWIALNYTDFFFPPVRVSGETTIQEGQKPTTTRSHVDTKSPVQTSLAQPCLTLFSCRDPSSSSQRFDGRLLQFVRGQLHVQRWVKHFRAKYFLVLTCSTTNPWHPTPKSRVLVATVENQFCFRFCINKEIVSISNAGQHVKSMPSIERRWLHFCIACSKAAMNSAGLIPSPCFTSPCIQNDCERNDWRNGFETKNK